MSNFRLILSLSLLCMLTSCSSATWLVGDSGAASDRVREDNLPLGSEIVSATDDKEIPLDLEIAQSFVEGDVVHVNIHVRPKTDFRPDDVVVSVIGLNEGLVVEQQHKWLSDVVQTEIIRPEQMIALRFDLNSAELTEYQVKCRWGEEAHQLARAQGRKGASEVLATADAPAEKSVDESSKPTPVVSAGKVRVEAIELEKKVVQCVRAPCDIFYTVVSKLVNDTNAAASGFKLGLGLYWANEGAEPVVPKTLAPLTEQEELIDLSSLTLNPGESKQLRIAVDRPIPEVPGGGFVPHLRLVEVDQPSARMQ